ncbi:MAG: cohesin domain-containing protein, partial [Verrucomicrobiota bacterium]
SKMRRVRLGWADLVAGQEVWVPVLLSGYGNENALAFNVEFDPSVIEYTGLKAATGSSQMENNLAAQEGRVGVILWKAAGKAVPPGESSVAELGFRVKAAVGSAKIRFGSRPVDSLIATVDAQPVTTVEFQGGEWSIAQRRRVVGGQMVSQHMAAGRWNVELQAIDSSGVPVSAVNRSIRVRSANRLDASDAEWTPVGVAPEVTPLGTLRLPLPQSADHTSQFYRIREE